MEAPRSSEEGGEVIDPIDKEIVGYVCATALGIGLLCVDGLYAITYAFAVGGAMVGVQIGRNLGK